MKFVEKQRLQIQLQAEAEKEVIKKRELKQQEMIRQLNIHSKLRLEIKRNEQAEQRSYEYSLIE